MYSSPFSARLAASCIAVGVLAAPNFADAQVNVQVGLPIPELQIRVGAPLVYVSPGVWVLPDSDEEVFYNGGWYWARSHGYWYRSRGRHSNWGVINEQLVPQPVRYIEPGRYRRFQAPERARTMPPRGWEDRRGPPVPKRMERGREQRGGVVQQQVQMRGAPTVIPTGRSGDGGGDHGRGGGRGHGGGQGGGGEHGRGRGH